MKKTFSALLAVGCVAAMSAATVAWADDYSAPAPAVSSSDSYSGPAYPTTCYGDKTSYPPSGYTQGCTPPPEWITYCTTKYQGFDVSDGYYHASDGFYYYCQ